MRAPVVTISSPHDPLPQILHHRRRRQQVPLHEKLVLIFKERVKEAEDDQDRARAERDLAKLQDGGSVD
jgi:hypothetical protein